MRGAILIRIPSVCCDIIFAAEKDIPILIRIPCAFITTILVGPSKWVVPCEKVSQNIDPFENHFFVINYQHWTGASALQPFWVPPDPWGGLGGPGGVWGGLPTPKLPLLFGDQFKPWNAMFWVKTTCTTMFLRFWVKWGPPGSKKGRFGPK